MSIKSFSIDVTTNGNVLKFSKDVYENIIIEHAIKSLASPLKPLLETLEEVSVSDPIKISTDDIEPTLQRYKLVVTFNISEKDSLESEYVY